MVSTAALAGKCYQRVSGKRYDKVLVKVFILSSTVRDYARRHGVIVIASIHQPNWETFAMFDKLLLLAQGRTMFYGPIR